MLPRGLQKVVTATFWILPTALLFLVGLDAHVSAGRILVGLVHAWEYCSPYGL